jgi:hypothetical protein
VSEAFFLAKARVHRRRLLGRTDVEVVTLSVDEGGLVLGDHRIERGAITAATVLPTSSRVRVRADGEGELDILVPDVAEGRALLRALRLDPARVTASYLVSTSAISGGCLAMVAPIALLVLSLIGAANLAVAFHARTPWLLPVAALVAVIAFLASPAKLTVGGSGVRLSWWGRQRFIPHAEIEHVEVYERTEETSKGPVHSVGVRLDGAQTVDIPVRSNAGGRELAELIAERIREASRGTPADGAAVSALARGPRPLRAWMDHLRAIGTGANLDARVAPLPAERLGTVLDDPQQSPRLRLAAAVALVAQSEASAPARIREIARACPDRKLRIALEAVTDPAREAEVLAALGEEDDDDAQRREAQDDQASPRDES